MRIEATPALSEHLDDADAPFVDIGGGSLLRVLQVRPSEGLSIVYGIEYRADSFLYEPAYSTHTLRVMGLPRGEVTVVGQAAAAV